MFPNQQSIFSNPVSNQSHLFGGNNVNLQQQNGAINTNNFINQNQQSSSLFQNTVSGQQLSFGNQSNSNWLSNSQNNSNQQGGTSLFGSFGHFAQNNTTPVLGGNNPTQANNLFNQQIQGNNTNSLFGAVNSGQSSFGQTNQNINTNLNAFNNNTNSLFHSSATNNNLAFQSQLNNSTNNNTGLFANNNNNGSLFNPNTICTNTNNSLFASTNTNQSNNLFNSGSWAIQNNSNQFSPNTSNSFFASPIAWGGNINKGLNNPQNSQYNPNNNSVKPNTFNMNYTLYTVKDDKSSYNYIAFTSNPQYKGISFEEYRTEDYLIRKIQRQKGIIITNTPIINSGSNISNSLIGNGQNMNATAGGNQGQGGSLFSQSNSIFNQISQPVNLLGQSNYTNSWFNQQQKSGGNLFGQATQNQSNWGIFSSNNNNNWGNNNNNQQQQQIGGGGLFNQSNNTGNSVLRGNITNSSNSNTWYGVFGNNTNTSNLFVGQTNQNQTGGGGWFNQSNTSNSTPLGGGWFNQSTTSNSTPLGGGWFNQSNTSNSTPLGGGFFNQSNTSNSTPLGGGWFGQTNVSNSGSLGGGGCGLFGQTNTSNSAAISGSLFGQTSTQNPTMLSSGGSFNQTYPQNQSQNNTGGLFGNMVNNGPSTTSTSLFGNLKTPAQKGDLFGNNTSTNAQQSFLFNQPSQNQQAPSLFSQQKPGLYELQMQKSQVMSNPLFNQSNPSGMIFQNAPLSSLFSNQIPMVPLIPESQNPINNVELKNYIYGIDQKTKSLEQIISELNTKTWPHDYETFNEFQDFLSYKRTFQKYKNTRVNKQEGISQATSSNHKQQLSNKKDSNWIPLKAEWFKNSKSYYTNSFDEKKSKKAHSCDFAKLNEKRVVTNLETTFKKELNWDELKQPRKISDSISYIDIQVQILEPHKVVFSLKISSNVRFGLLKSSILQTWKNKNKHYSSLTASSFILMKKYSIVKETKFIKDSGWEDKDTLFIIWKESINQSDYTDTTTQGKGNVFSNSEKKKTKMKAELAPLDKVPIWTKIGYKIKPEWMDIYRMSLEELEQVAHFEIYNEHGKIEFLENVDWTGLNLDQIVKISPGEVEVYKNNDISFWPKVGMGLNKKAMVTLYNIDEYCNNMNFWNVQTMHDKIKMIKGEFTHYDKEKKEFVFKLEHF